MITTLNNSIQGILTLERHKARHKAITGVVWESYTTLSSELPLSRSLFASLSLSLFFSLALSVCLFVPGPIITLESLGSGGPQSKLSRRHWLRLFKQPAVCAVIITHLCTASTFFTLLSWLPTYFKDTFPDAKGWVFNVIPWFVSIPSSLFSGCLSDHLISKGHDTAAVRKLMQFFSMGVSSVFTLLLCGTTTFPLAVAFVSVTMGPASARLAVCMGWHHMAGRCVPCWLAGTAPRVNGQTPVNPTQQHHSQGTKGSGYYGDRWLVAVTGAMDGEVVWGGGVRDQGLDGCG
ncbi:unnamed protein product [Oncorhynchus mykiss]|uniref:Major facilitator superfamily (MFS) profile domain-containing protein n=1 Tax=Oncorhynchus mykiss TaxID=8022 RepID=A0A060XXM4_ONCMY|nr:unnamed protein product [Oncorhynchus mykiss]